MKYLKTFESLSLKKYIICKGTESYTTLEIVKLIDNFSIIVRTLAFSKRNDTVFKSAKLTISFNLYIEDRIIFQSDDINEIKTQLDILQNKDKYNI